ncbi:MAG: phosphotransferase [Candidatus Latescibacterota bacterium]
MVERLRQAGLVAGGAVRVTPLGGGVSSDILVVDDGRARFVVKRALARLRVADHWMADPARNRFEQAYLRYAARVVPGSVPQILFADEELGFFAMEYVGGGWRNWKQDLLAGRVQGSPAARAGRYLAAVHGTSWQDETVAARFDTTPLFRQLRIEPYLVTAAERSPALRALLMAEAERLSAVRLALVHGDFSPRNLLVRAGGLKVLDCEVAWFGEPAFDVAFLLNHLFLKSLHRPDLGWRYMALVETFLRAYAAGLGARWDDDLQARVAWLLPMLLLARVVGKSPAEYLAGRPVRAAFAVSFAAEVLPQGVPDVARLRRRWLARLSSLP